MTRSQAYDLLGNAPEAIPVRPEMFPRLVEMVEAGEFETLSIASVSATSDCWSVYRDEHGEPTQVVAHSEPFTMRFVPADS